MPHPDEQPLAVWDIAARTALGGAERVDEAFGHELNLPARIADFDVKREVGAKGVRTLDRGAALALAAIARLTKLTNLTDKRHVGLVVTTSIGSFASTVHFTQDSLTQDRPYLVDPSQFPNTVMNFTAGQAAIRHGLRGPNATLIAGTPSGLYALHYARRLIKLGQAHAVVVGGAEEWTEDRVRLEHDGKTSTTLVEGAAALLVGPPDLLLDTAPLATIGTIATGVATDDERRERLVERWRARQTWPSTPSHVIGVGDPETVERTLRAMRRGIPAAANAPSPDQLGGSGGDLGSWGATLAATVATMRATRSGHSWVLAADRCGPVALASITAPAAR